MVFDLSDFTKQIILSFGIVLDIEISLRASRPKFCLKYAICKIFSTSIFEMPENKGFLVISEVFKVGHFKVGYKFDPRYV